MALREKSALYPKVTWNDCLEFVQTIAAFNLKSVSYIEVAKKYGLRNPTAKSFTSRISTSKQFGLITTSGGDTIQLTDICKRILFPTGEDMRPIELSCFALPPLYNKLIAAYNGKAVPNQDILANILMSSHRIQPSVKDAAAKCFIESAIQLDLIKGGVLCYSDATAGSFQSQPIPVEDPVPENHESVPAPVVLSTVSPVASVPMENDADYISQAIPVASGKVARFIIPVDSTEDDLLLLRDMFDVLLKRKFKVQIE